MTAEVVCLLELSEGRLHRVREDSSAYLKALGFLETPLPRRDPSFKVDQVKRHHEPSYPSRVTKSPELAFHVLLESDGARDVRFKRVLAGRP